MQELLTCLVASPAGPRLVAAEEAILAVMPQAVINRSGCMDILKRLIGQGRVEEAQTYLWLIRQVVKARYRAGYTLPWHSVGDMMQGCAEEGLTVESVDFLYRANLLDFPSGGQPAAIYAKSGYSGEIRPIRDGWVTPPQQQPACAS